MLVITVHGLEGPAKQGQDGEQLATRLATKTSFPLKSLHSDRYESNVHITIGFVLGDARSDSECVT